MQLQNVALVDRGFTADVYHWGEGRVVKLFHRWYPPRKAEREYRVTRAVHQTGLPVPAVYELVNVDDRCGIVFERVEGLPCSPASRPGRGRCSGRSASWRSCTPRFTAVSAQQSCP